MLEQQRDDAHLTERSDEGECQRYAGEVGEHAGAALDDPVQHAPGLSRDDRRREPCPEDGADDRRPERQDQAVLEREPERRR